MSETVGLAFRLVLRTDFEDSVSRVFVHSVRKCINHCSVFQRRANLTGSQRLPFCRDSVDCPALSLRLTRQDSQEDFVSAQCKLAAISSEDVAV